MYGRVTCRNATVLGRYSWQGNLGRCRGLASGVVGILFESVVLERLRGIGCEVDLTGTGKLYEVTVVMCKEMVILINRSGGWSGKNA